MWQTFTRAIESHKIGTFVGFFCPKLKMYELKIYKLFVMTMKMTMTMKKDAKLDEELTCCFKIDMRTFAEF